MTRSLNIQHPRWAEDFASLKTREAKRYRGAFGGRGSGKSYECADMLIERCLYEYTPVVCGREVQKSLEQSAKRVISKRINDLGVADWFEVQQNKIKAPHNAEIIFVGMQDHNAESIQSYDGFKIFWGEEARAFSQTTLDIIRPTFRFEKPGVRKKMQRGEKLLIGDIAELWFTWNPKFETDPIDKFLRGSKIPERSVVVETNYWNNPWFPQILQEEMEFDRENDIDKYLWVWKGRYLQYSEARIFKNWRVEEFESPPEAMHRLGADFGFTHPATLIRSHLRGNKLYIDYEAYKVNCEIDDLPELYSEVPDSRSWPIIADSSRPDTISYLHRHGYPKIFKSIKGKGSIDEGIKFLKKYEIIVHPRCTHTIDELSMYSWKIDPKTKLILPIPADKENHIIDPLRYAHEGHIRAQKQEDNDRPYYPPIPTTSPYNRN
jgi:phage terminase large subunit